MDGSLHVWQHLWKIGGVEPIQREAFIVKSCQIARKGLGEKVQYEELANIPIGKCHCFNLGVTAKTKRFRV